MDPLNPKPPIAVISQQNRPLITYDGDIAIFQSITPYLQKGIGAETVEWKRAYGRSTKHVHLHPRFVPFNNPETSAVASSSNVPSIAAGAGVVPEDASGPAPAKEGPPLASLLDQQMLHTYWTDCADVEIYKSTTKDAIQSWLNNVKECNVKDWFIILVETPDNKKTKQLLPRSSVLDKIKSDFAQKQTERCICLSDPNKLDSKSAESLHAMLHRLRQLLLSSYSKTMTKFEENMRERREKRNEPGWNFCHYFLLQEELALVLEMLEVYDEALVQYDELDALFTQFVLNSHLTDTPQWLLSFQRYGDHWPALTLSSCDSTQILNQIRETIRNSTVSLLNFRNYLFTRQATLLVQQKRINELAQRSLGFLHNCINELSILDVTFSEEGAMSSWVFVSCLEVLEVICDHGQAPPLVNGSSSSVLNNNENLKKSTSTRSGAANQQHHQNLMLASDFSVHTASIWDYAREKLYELGKMHDLLPKCKPRGDHLHRVVSLAAGLTALDNNIISSSNNSSAPAAPAAVNGHSRSASDCGVTYISTIPQHDTSRDTPIEKLKNALSSKEKFEHHYLELCELGMGTYKHIGRLRSARKVGLSLAEFYMEGGEYQKAISFLSDALKTYEADKWSHLVMAVLLQLAQCYQEIKDNDRYIRTCKQLACSSTMEIERRTLYFDEVMKCLQMYKNESPLRSSFEDTFSIVSITIETSGKIDLDSCQVTIALEFVSKFPKALENCKIESALLVCDHEHLNKKQQQLSESASHGQGHGNLSSASFSSQSGAPLSSKGSQRKHAHAHAQEHAKSKATSEIATICEEEDASLTVSEISDVNNMKLNLGQQFDVKQDKSVQGGRLFCQNSHIALRRKDSQIADDVQIEKTDFKIAAISEDIIINPGSNVAKLYTKITEPGAYRLGQISVRVKQLELLSRRMGCRYNFKIEKVPGSIELASADANLNLIAGIEQVITLVLTTGSNRIESGTNLKIRSSIGLQLKLSENSPLCTELSVPLPPTKSFTSTTVQLRVKAELGPQKDSNLIEHKLMICCPWTNEETKLRIVFAPPFRSSHKLNTVGSRKFLQVTLHGLSSSNFIISNHQLAIQGQLSQDIPIVPLNPRSQELILANRMSASYMWEIGVEHYDDEAQIRLEFSTTFSSQQQMQEQNPELYKYYVCLQKFKTQYEVNSRVELHKGAEFVRVGNMCSMIIDVQRVQKAGDVENSLMYEVRADQYIWAICGKTAGVISMEGTDQQQIKLDVMPMSAGFLPLPTVHFSKYVLGDPKGGGPKLEAFNPGQIFTKCKGAQLHIIPPPQPLQSNQNVGGIGVPPITVNASDSHF